MCIPLQRMTCLLLETFFFSPWHFLFHEQHFFLVVTLSTLKERQLVSDYVKSLSEDKVPCSYPKATTSSFC